MIKTYKDLKGRTWDQPGIPKWIFRAGNESLENLHPEIAQIYNTQLENNPGYELFYFSKEDKLQFIKDQNDSDLLSAYTTIIPETYKTDIFRYVIVNLYGGVYMDFSMQTLIPFSDIIKHYTYVYAKDTAGDYNGIQGLYCAFIISPKNNPLLKATIEKCIYNITNRMYTETDLCIVSPHLFGEVYRELNNVADIPLGVVGKDTIIYDHRVPNQFIESSPGVNIVQIKHPKHYEILYTTQERYGVLWKKGEIYGEPNMIKTFKDLKDRKWEGDGVPKWIFKTGPFKLENLPEIYRHIFLDILKKNPGYELFYFSDEDCLLSIYHHYGEEYFRLHQKLIPTAYQADFWRYLILKQYGGCYGDFSQIPLIPYDKIIEDSDRVFVRDDPSDKSYLYNAFMCAKAGDDVVSKAVEISAYNIKNNKYDGHPLGIVGPKVLGEAFIKQGYKKYSNNPHINIGTYKGSKILRNLNGVVQDEFENNVFINKLGNHVDVVYGNKYGKLHYHQAWMERRVYKY